MADEEKVNLIINGVSLELDKTEISKVLEEGKELTVKNDDIQVYTNDDFNTFVENKTKERYEAGKEKGVKDEIIKAIEKHKLNLDEKAKTIDNFADALNQKLTNQFQSEYEGKIKEPTQKVKELQSDNDTLRNSNQEWENKYNDFVNKAENERKTNAINNTVLSNLKVKARDEEGKQRTVISPEDLLVIFNTQHSPKFNDDNMIVSYTNGEVIKDKKTLNIMPVDKVIDQFLTPYFKQASGGTGGNDLKKNQTAGSYEAFVKEMSEKNINEGSSEFQKELNKRVEEKTLVI